MGQLAIEFLFSFLIALAFVGLLAASLAAQIDAFGSQNEECLRILKSESAARAIEALYYSGIESTLNFGGDGVRYRIETGCLHSDYLGKVVETRGVFSHDRSEPL